MLRERLPRANPANADADTTRRKIDQIVEAVIAAGHERDFDTIAEREIKQLQRAATRPFLVAV
ncbi:MAG TPA: hypothetical protein VGI86_15865 [Acidimicrobiia bacterium]